MPFLKKITFHWEKAQSRKRYPFNVPSLSRLKALDMNHNVIFFVGENGSGKSTLMEAIAHKCGFANKGGGNYGIVDNPDDSLMLETIMTLSWLPKVSKGFFLRAETFIDFACLGALIYNFDGGSVKPIEYEDTEHYRLTKAFLNNRESFLKQLFEDDC